MTASSASPRLAVFDLDGTITRGDTYLLFLRAALREWPLRALRLPLAVPPLLAFALGHRDRGRLKGALLRALLAGLSRAKLQPFVARFVGTVMAGSLHREALETIARHREAGDRLVLMSASPDLYVPAIAAALGFDECICSPLQWAGDRLDGRLSGENVRGSEKLRQLLALRARNPGLAVAAYGNAGSDLPHLRECEVAVYVNARAAERATLSREGLHLVEWH